VGPAARAGGARAGEATRRGGAGAAGGAACAPAPTRARRPAGPARPLARRFEVVTVPSSKEVRPPPGARGTLPPSES